MKVGDIVEKNGGDYSYSGAVVAVFDKRDGGAPRIVVEDFRGLLLIMRPDQVKVIKEAP